MDSIHNNHTSKAMRSLHLFNNTERSFGRWLTLVWFAVVVGAVCCTGAVIVTYNAFFSGQVDIIVMIAVFAPMGLIMALLLWRVMKVGTRTVDELSAALHQVASGDFSVELDTAHVGGPTRIMYDDFNTMTENLRANELLRKNFVANFSHEFKTPINSINGFATLLLDNLEGKTALGDEERASYLHIIASESDRLAHLSTNTMLLNRLESQTIIESCETFSLDEQIRSCLVLLQHVWLEKKLELDINLDETSFWGNQEMMKEVWINLLGNAIKFTPKGGTLGVRLVRENKECRAYIRDTGIGMTDDVRKRIFDRYYQGDPSHATKGHGLGLAITQRIVELSGGTIEVESTPGAGSVFIVTLPLRDGGKSAEHHIGRQ